MLMLYSSNQITSLTDIDVLICKWEDYLQILVDAEKMAMNTAALYRKGFSKLLEYCNARNQQEDQDKVNVITATVIDQWLGHLLKAEKKTPATANAWLSGVKAFYSWAEMNGFLINPAKNIKGAKQGVANQWAYTN